MSRRPLDDSLGAKIVDSASRNGGWIGSVEAAASRYVLEWGRSVDLHEVFSELARLVKAGVVTPTADGYQLSMGLRSAALGMRPAAQRTGEISNQLDLLSEVTRYELQQGGEDRDVVRAAARLGIAGLYPASGEVGAPHSPAWLGSVNARVKWIILFAILSPAASAGALLATSGATRWGYALVISPAALATVASLSALLSRGRSLLLLSITGAIASIASLVLALLDHF